MKADAFENWLRDGQRPPLVMGVLNVTPDSFSDGGRFLDAAAAVDHAERMVEDGADLIDVGGESTRPGAQPVSPDEQVRRTVPVVEAVAGRLPVTVSIDTTSAAVAAAALDAGAAVVNDVSAGRFDPELLPLVARRRAAVILMHMRGTPQTMQQDPTYNDVVAEVAGFLRERTAKAVSAGVEPFRILLDPGIGFGKTIEHNLELLRRTSELAAPSRPLVVGTSRKRFIGTVTGEADPAGRVYGTAATVAWAVANGAAIVRVHDVKPMKQVVATVRAIQLGLSAVTTEG